MAATIASPHALATELAAFMAALHRSASGAWIEVVSDLDLSVSQVKAMHVLGEQGELSVKEVSAALSLSLPATSRALDALLRRGLVERRECVEDRRSRLVQVTAAGRAVYVEVMASRIAGLAEFLEALAPEERDALAAAIAPVIERTR